MKIRIADVVEESFVDGDGIRFAIFVQGCPHRCKGCHNPNTHDFNGGKIVNIEDLIIRIKKNPLLSGITLTGGEPLSQPEVVTELAKAAKDLNLNVWCYTGFIYEDVADDMEGLLKFVDVLVDGPFIESQRDISLQFCGSTNQRLIDIPKTRTAKKIILWSPS